MATSGKFEELGIRYYGIRPAEEGCDEVCLNDFFAIVSGKATHEAVEAALMDSEVVDVTPTEDEGIIQIGCRLAGCNKKFDLEIGLGFTAANECYL